MTNPTDHDSPDHAPDTDTAASPPPPDDISAPHRTGPLKPSSPEMAEKLAINRTGKLTPEQRRVALLGGLFALSFTACPTIVMLQFVGLALMGRIPTPSIPGLIIGVLGLLVVAAFFGMFGVNVVAFLGEYFGKHPVRYARGPLEIRMTEGERPELPFSYIVDDYSFAPYILPRDVEPKAGADYLVYYSARSRLLLSMFALDASDADQWQPEFE